jgi:hypothetical protein
LRARASAKAPTHRLLNLTWSDLTPKLLAEGRAMAVDKNERTKSAPPAKRGGSSRILKPRPVVKPRPHEEIIADAEKKFSKTLAYLAR